MTKEELALQCIDQLTESFDLLPEVRVEFLCGNILCTTEIPAADYCFSGYAAHNMACIKQIERVQTCRNILVYHSLARQRQFAHLVTMENDRVPAVQVAEDGETRYLAARVDRKSGRVEVGYVQLRGVRGYLALK